MVHQLRLVGVSNVGIPKGLINIPNGGWLVGNGCLGFLEPSTVRQGFTRSMSSIFFISRKTGGILILSS